MLQSPQQFRKIFMLDPFNLYLDQEFDSQSDFPIIPCSSAEDSTEKVAEDIANELTQFVKIQVQTIKSHNLIDHFPHFAAQALKGLTFLISRPHNRNLVLMSETQYQSLLQLAKGNYFSNRLLLSTEIE